MGRLHQSGHGSTRVPSGSELIESRVIEIKAVKAKDSHWSGQPFSHKFTKPAKMYALPSGWKLPSGAVKIYARVEEVRGKDGVVKSRHGGPIYGLRNGQVVVIIGRYKYLIVSRHPNWDNFQY